MTSFPDWEGMRSIYRKEGGIRLASFLQQGMSKQSMAKWHRYLFPRGNFISRLRELTSTRLHHENKTYMRVNVKWIRSTQYTDLSIYPLSHECLKFSIVGIRPLLHSLTGHRYPLGVHALRHRGEDVALEGLEGGEEVSYSLAALAMEEGRHHKYHVAVRSLESGENSVFHFYVYYRTNELR